jgi:hypothetical protein
VAILILSLVLLGVFSWLATHYNWFHSSDTKPIEETPAEEICCGLHDVCEKDSLQITDPTIVYYDDDELDVFANRPADSYTREEVRLFEYVFDTLSPGEVSGWLRSLQLRHIQMPSGLMEEALLVVTERRLEAQ